MLELIINKNNDVETICLVENGKLVEKYQDDQNTKNNRLEGNIYAGKVSDIILGMQSAFIDYGDSKKGLLHLKDALPQVNEKNKDIDLGNKKITDVLKPNQKILIQIKKDSNDKKGAKISTHISIPSKYIVFMPNTDIITISQKIEDKQRKEELIELGKESLSSKEGVVIRTSAELASNEERRFFSFLCFCSINCIELFKCFCIYCKFCSHFIYCFALWFFCFFKFKT